MVALRGIEAGGEEVQGHFVARCCAELDGVGVVGGERVVVGDEEEALVLWRAVFVGGVLQLDPVVERAHVVAEMEPAGGSHAAEYALWR